MRSYFGWAVVVGVLFAVTRAFVTGQDPDAPKQVKVSEVSLLLPASWRTQISPDETNPGVVLIGDGGSIGRLTIARLPSAASTMTPADSKLDPITSPQTADMRIALEEAGLTPVSGSIASNAETGRTVEALSFRCKRTDGSEVIVLTATWRSGSEAVRARLQYSDVASPQQASLLAAIRSSLRYLGQQTLGFGSFNLADVPPLPEWVKLAGTPQVAVVPAKLTPPSSLNAPATPSPTPDEALPADLGRMVQDYRGSLVFIEGGGGAGSGFVCQMKDGFFLLTNQHVLAGMNVPRFTRLDQTPITVGVGGAAAGHDIMRFTLPAESKPLVAMVDVEKEAKIGDDIVVLGNSEGARVIQPLAGKLIGIGPDRVEVSAEFVPGNSGSPIIHAKSGKVIGIATYLIQRRFKDLTSPTDSKVRRFGYRLDSVKQWQPLNWAAFQQDKSSVDRVETGTKELVLLIKQLEANKWPDPAGYTNASLSRAVRDLTNQASRTGVSLADRQRYLVGFFAAVRNATQADITQARQSIRYDYFQRALSEEGQVREEMFQIFDRIVKSR